MPVLFSVCRIFSKVPKFGKFDFFRKESHPPGMYGMRGSHAPGKWIDEINETGDKSRNIFYKGVLKRGVKQRGLHSIEAQHEGDLGELFPACRDVMPWYKGVFSFLCFFVILSSVPLYGQVSYFRIQGGIPYLPVYSDAGSIANPESGMLVYDQGCGCPVFYTGSSWVDLCHAEGSFNGGVGHFSVEGGIPVIATLPTVPGNARSGSVYFSGSDNKLMVCDGSGWHSTGNFSGGSFSIRGGFHGGLLSSGACDFPVLPNDPSTGGEGAIYINQGRKSFRYHDGLGWHDVNCGAVVYTLAVSGQTGYEAESGGEITSQGSSAIIRYGICWSAGINPDVSLPTRTEGTGIFTVPGTFTSTMSGLLPNTTYHVRAYAENSEGVYYGEDITFTTPIALARIITLAAGNITSITAESGGDITDDGGSPVTKRGIWWSVTGDPLLAGSAPVITDDGSGVGTYPSTLTGLLGNTTYYVRAYAINVAGIAYGNLVSVTTPAPVVPELKSSTTVSRITGSTGEVSASVVNNGGAPVTEVGACWWTISDPAYHYVSSGKTEDLDEGDFSSVLTGLEEGVTYYVKGYALNKVGYGYSSETSFITATLATITTTAPAGITGTGAVSGGTVSDIGYSPVTVRGICWGTSPDPDVSLTGKTVLTVPAGDDGLGSFTSNLTNLTPGTKYYVRAYAENGAGVSYGNPDSLHTLDYPSVKTLAVASFVSDTGIGGGNITDDGGSIITERGVCWGLAENPAYSSSHTTDGTGTGLYSSTLTGLTPDVTYHVRAYARNSVGISYGDDLTFTRIAGLPSVTTADIVSITSTGAEAGGVVTDTGGANVTSRGILYSQGGDPLTGTGTIDIPLGSSTGSFGSTLSGLSGSTVYYVRAYAGNRAGTAYGALVYFTTLSPVLPSLSATVTISNVRDISATGSVEVLNNGGSPVTARGIYLSTDRITYVYYPSSTVSGSDIGTFTSDLTGLLPGTMYYARGYAINSAGTVYTSGEVSFTTLSPARLTTTAATGITGETALSGGNITSDGGSGVTARGVCWSTTSHPDTDDFHTRDGSGPGIYTSSITGLTPGTKYYIRAYAVTGLGTCYGNLDSLTTLSYPEVSTSGRFHKRFQRVQ